VPSYLEEKSTNALRVSSHDRAVDRDGICVMARLERASGVICKRMILLERPPTIDHD
jgi:hypothetical protein